MATPNKKSTTPAKPTASAPAKPAPGKAAPAKPSSPPKTLGAPGPNGLVKGPTGHVYQATAQAKVAQAPTTPAPDADESDLDGDDVDGDAATSDSSTDAKADGASASVDDLSTNERYKLHLRSLSPAKRQAVLINNLVERTKRQQDAISGWQGADVDAVRAILTSVADGLKLASDGLAALPEDYKPRVAGGGKRSTTGVELKAGDVVRVTDKRREEYDGVLEPGQDRGMSVIEVRGNKVIVMLTGQIKAMFPRGHVTIDDGSAAAPATDDTSTETV